MLQITVQEKTYLLAADTTFDDVQTAVLGAVRTAPAFLSLHTAHGRRIEIMLTAHTTVTLEEHAELPAPDEHDNNEDHDYDDLYGIEFS